MSSEIAQRSSGERGVFIPLAGALAGGVIVILLALGFDTFITKKAHFALLAKTDEICEKVASSAIIQAETDGLFQENLREFDVRNVRVTFARLILPTMPANSSFGDGAYSEPQVSIPLSSTVEIAGEQVRYEYHGAPGHSPSDVPGYPAGFWSDQADAGRRVGCEITGEVSGLVFGHRQISARVVHSLELEGSPLDGVTIAVAPELVTGDLSHGPPLSFDVNEISSHYRFEVSNNPADFPPPGMDPFKPPLPAPYYAAGKNVVAPLYHSDSDFRGQMLRSCTNPLILARNTFSSVLAEMLARSGRTRRNTEVLLVNPKDMDGGENSPVLIKERTQDLVPGSGGGYQIPYVSFVENELAPGRLDPVISDTAGSISSQKRYHSLLASQLRNCYHLYWKPESTTPPLERYNPDNLDGYGRPFWPNNGDFEPDNGSQEGSRSSYYFSPVLRKRRYDDTQRWDQHCAWGEASCAMDRTRLLSIPEILSSLGSVQRCPGLLVDPSVACLPEINSGFNLRPSFIGLMNYLTNRANAIASPGLWDISASGVIPANAPPQNKRTSTVLITHFAPQNDTEADAIAALLSPDYMDGSRLLTVVFMPFNQEEYNNRPKLCRALSLGSACDELDETIDQPRYLMTLWRDPSMLGDPRRYWMELLTRQEAGSADSILVDKVKRLVTQRLFKARREL